MKPVIDQIEQAGGPAVDGLLAASISQSPNVRWQRGRIDRSKRWRELGTVGATVWLTGLPSSGKSTLAAAIEQRLVESGRHAYLLDGDNLRHGICSDLGFSREDRARNVRRVGELAMLFADSGAVALVALVSPYAAEREEVRRRHIEAGLPYLEVFVDTPLWLCQKRDPKGLYARARAGEICSFTGVDDPYEPPAQAEVVVRPQAAVEEAVDEVLSALADRTAQLPPTGRRQFLKSRLHSLP